MKEPRWLCQSPQRCHCHMNGMSLNLRQKKHGKTLSFRTSYPSLKKFRWRNCYSSMLFSGNPNVTNAAIHQTDTGDSSPIRCSQCKVPQRLESEVNKEIDKMLELGIIRPSNSPWASPVVFVPKPDGTIRVCVDYRKLNSVTKMDAYTIPSMERMIE